MGPDCTPGAVHFPIVTRVAFVICSGLPGVVEDDLPAARALEAMGVTVVPVSWDAPGVEWTSFDAVVIRSTWDYHLHAARYERWLRQRAAEGTRLWNPASAVIGNLHKRYLADFERRGVPIVPTAFLDAAEGRVLAGVLDALGCDEAVVKPAVSANAKGTWRVSRASAEVSQPSFEAQARAGDLLVQPYLPEVASEGEWSLMFFRGRYSHAVLKRPASGEFRVQEHLGGGAAPAEPPEEIVEQAHAALDACGSELLYARVDGIRRAGRFLLMELEINEPSLFIGSSPGAAGRFADAIMAVTRA